MTNSSLPEEHRWAYEEFAILNVTVTHITPLDGNSGHSTVRFNIDAGAIWLGTEPGGPNAQQDITIQLMGSNEHELLARAFRQVADQLDAAPEANRRT